MTTHTTILTTIRTRVAGFDPDEFWTAAPGLDAWTAMADKYAALAELAKTNAEQRTPKLRHASRRWPGSLREAELIGPVRVDERASAAAIGLLEPDRSRASWFELVGAPTSWTEAPALAVVAWASLHPKLEDLRRFRQTREVADSQAFARWLERTGPNPRWPRPERIVDVVGPKLRVRSAYLWLAAIAGLDLPSLNALLLARAGHWDRRPDDPPWAHDEG